MTLVVHGNPVDGFEFIGPFTFWDDAREWAEIHLKHEKDWWLLPVTSPKEWDE